MRRRRPAGPSGPGPGQKGRLSARPALAQAHLGALLDAKLDVIRPGLQQEEPATDSLRRVGRQTGEQLDIETDAVIARRDQDLRRLPRRPRRSLRKRKKWGGCQGIRT